MGRDPLVLTVDGWEMQVSVKDHWTQIAIITDDDPPQTHYVRITMTQSGVLRDYLADVLPVSV